MVQGPPWGYSPDPTKSILVVSLRNVPQAKDLFWGYRLQVVMGSWYLGGFVGTEISQDWWLEEKERWRDSVPTLAGVAHCDP